MSALAIRLERPLSPGRRGRARRHRRPDLDHDRGSRPRSRARGRSSRRTRRSLCAAGEIVSIHLDARTSGTVRSAELAAREASIPVVVLDARTVSFGVGLCVRAAAQALADGASAAAAVAAGRAAGDLLGNLFVARAGIGGRVPDAPEWSLLEFDDGKIHPLVACAGLEEAIHAMAGRAFEEDGRVCAAVGHAGKATASAADALALALESQAHVVEVERYRVGAAVGAHTGPLSFGAFWWPAP